MSNRINLRHKVGTGISPIQFIETMTQNQAEFLSWYDRFAWRPEDRAFFSALQARKDLYCLILCTDWCPDVIYNGPVLFKVMEEAKIPTEILPMEQHLETMDLFLTGGGRNQPIAVIVNANGEELGHWGARPQYLQAIMDAFRAANPDREAEGYKEKVFKVRQEIAAQYEAGTGYQDVVVKELRSLFERVL